MKSSTRASSHEMWHQVFRRHAEDWVRAAPRSRRGSCPVAWTGARRCRWLSPRGPVLGRHDAAVHRRRRLARVRQMSRQVRAPSGVTAPSGVYGWSSGVSVRSGWVWSSAFAYWGLFKVGSAIGGSELAGPRQLGLLALLALNANRAVSSDVIVEKLWGSDRGGATKSLQMTVARIRKALTAAGRGRRGDTAHRRARLPAGGHRRPARQRTVCIVSPPPARTRYRSPTPEHAP